MIRQAVYSRKLDLSKFDPYSYIGQMYAKTVLEDTAKELTLKTYEDLHQYNVGMAGSGGEDYDFRKRALNRAFDALQNISRLRFPWLDQEKGTGKTDKSTALQMRNDWEKIWGKMDSPETKARIEKTVRWLEKHTKNK